MNFILNSLLQNRNYDYNSDPLIINPQTSELIINYDQLITGQTINNMDQRNSNCDTINAANYELINTSSTAANLGLINNQSINSSDNNSSSAHLNNRLRNKPSYSTPV